MFWRDSMGKSNAQVTVCKYYISIFLWILPVLAITLAVIWFAENVLLQVLVITFFSLA